METFLWISQSFLALVFLYSGICKAIYSEQKLVSMGQTGVDGLPLALIRFIGIVEILGATGIFLPLALNLLLFLVPVSAIGFAMIMLPAAVVHYRHKEMKQVLFNCTVLLLSVVVAVGRRGFL